MAASRTDFGAWFANTQGDVGGSISSSSAATAAPATSSGGYFSGLFGGAGPAAPSSQDIENGQSETTSFLASASRSVGSLLGQTPSAPPVDDWTCGLSTLQRFQIALMLGGGAAVLFFMAIFVFLPSELWKTRMCMYNLLNIATLCLSSQWSYFSHLSLRHV